MPDGLLAFFQRTNLDHSLQIPDPHVPIIISRKHKFLAPAHAERSGPAFLTNQLFSQLQGSPFQYQNITFSSPQKHVLVRHHHRHFFPVKKVTERDRGLHQLQLLGAGELELLHGEPVGKGE